MSVETKIQQLLEGKTEKKQLVEDEHMPTDLSAKSIGNVGQKTSAAMKQDTSKAGKAANPGAKAIQMQGSSEKPSVDEFDEDQKNLGAKSAASVSKAPNPDMKGDAKTAKVPAMEENDSEEEVITEVDITSELNSIFGEDLSEDFKKKATSIFEAAVVARVNNEIENISTKLEEQNAEDLVDYKNGLVEKVNGYLNYVVEQWAKENQIAIENGLKNEITEEFISGLKTLFKEHYVQVPEDKYDVLNDLTDKVDTITTELDEAVQDNMELANQLVDFKKKQIIRELSNDLAATESEKFNKLVEGVEFEEAELFKEKVSVIKENYFPKEAKNSPESETKILTENGQTSEFEGATNSVMSKYASAISRGVNARAFSSSKKK